MRALFVNEEKIGEFFQYKKGSSLMEIFMNPQSVKRMDNWARAFVDKEGNFFVGSLKGNRDNDDYDDILTTHNILLTYIIEVGYLKDVKWMVPGPSDIFGYGYYSNAIALQRNSNTKDWYISESTDKLWIKQNLNFIVDIFKKLDDRNIFYLNLIPKRITEIYSKDSPTEFTEVDSF